MPTSHTPEPGQQAQHLLYYDDLTGLYNRRFYNRAYAEQTKKATDDQSPIGMILIDVDFFKSINDRYGHQSGDAILSGVGGVINETVGMSGYPIRYAGDEFVVLMPGLSRDESTQVAEALSENVRKRTFRLVNNDRSVKITFSVGVSHYPSDTDDPARLFESADHAAYIAKKNGRDRVVNYQAGVKQVLNASTLYQFFPCQKLIGREKVMETLVEHLMAPAGERRPWFVVGGLPGIGKTRLLLELRNRVDTQRSVLLETVGLPARPQQPFGFFVDAMGRYIRENPAAGQQMAAALSAREIASMARLLPDLSRYAMMVSSDGAQTEATELDPVEGFCTMLGVLAHNRSLTILLDDFQQADKETLRLVERLRARLPQVFLCTALRDDAETLEKNGVLERFVNDVVTRRAATYVELPAFTAAQVQELIETVFPDAKAYPDLGALVHAKSGGVALYVEEVLKLLVQTGAMRYDGPSLIIDVNEEQIPADVDALLEARAEQVDLDVRQLMARAAVIGAEFDLGTLMLLEGRDEGYLRGLLERARKSHIISESVSESAERISFVSTQTHGAFYRSLPEDERRRLHHRLGRMRERQYASQLDHALSELAFHFHRAGEPERARQYRKMINELYSQFVGASAVDSGVAGASLKQLVGQVDLPEPLLQLAVEIASELKICLQKQRMYGTAFLTRQRMHEKLASRFAELFRHVDSVTYSEADRKLLVNGVSLPQHLQFASGIVETLVTYDVRALEFKSGVLASDLKACIELFAMNRDELRASGGIGTLLREGGIDTIVANEKIFVMVGERDIVLKRTDMRDEMLIKEVAEADLAASLPARGLADGGSANVPAADYEAFAAWREAFTRYASLELLSGADRDWTTLQRDLESGERTKVLAASKVYVDAGADAIDPLLSVILTTSVARVRSLAVSLLTRVTDDAREQLLDLLDASPTPAEACTLIEALSMLADPAVPACVEPFVQHSDASVRRAATALLATQGPEDLAPALVRALEADDPDVRRDAITAMGTHRCHETADALLRLTEIRSLFGHDETPEVQAAACTALGCLAEPRLLEPLLAVIDASNPLRARPAQARAAAAAALPRFVTPQTHARIADVLAAHTHDAETQVAEAAREALRQMGLEPPTAPPTMPMPDAAPASAGTCDADARARDLLG